MPSGTKPSLLRSLALAIHAFSLYGVIQGGLEIEPQRLLIEASPLSSERQATFTCLEDSPMSSSGRPSQEVVWLKDGHIIETKGNRKYIHRRLKRKLEIRQLDVNDSGIYECAINPNSTERGRAELWVSPLILFAPTLQILWRNSLNAKVECLVTGGKRTVDWWKNSLLIASTDPAISAHQDPHYKIMENGSLLISQVTGLDRGLYRCIARNPAGQVYQEIRLRVNRPTEPPPTVTTPTYVHLPSPRNRSHCTEYSDVRLVAVHPLINLTSGMPSHTTSSPYFTIVPHPCVQARVGYTIVLSCAAEGVPTPYIRWSKDGQLLNTTEQEATNGFHSHYVQFSNGSLLITTVQPSDTGLYTCTAFSYHGNTTTDVQLEVIGELEVCGVKGQPHEDMRKKRIVHGFAISGIHEWPWQVLIEYQEDRSLSHLPLRFCSGVLIQAGWIVTAAHCLLDRHRQWRPKESLIVRTGVHNRSNDEEQHQQLLKVHRYIVHPSYSASSGVDFPEHDIALIQLAIPVHLSPYVGTICLPPQPLEPPVGSVCTVTGWGRLLEGVNEYPELLHQGDVPLVSFSDCSSRDSYRGAVTNNMLCAGWENGGTDACQNDSGGPLVCEIPQNPGRWALYGVVNYGDGCGRPDKYGIYAQVTKYLSWIKNILSSS